MYVTALETLLVFSIVIGADIKITCTPRASPEHHGHTSLLRGIRMGLGRSVSSAIADNMVRNAHGGVSLGKGWFQTGPNARQRCYYQVCCLCIRKVLRFQNYHVETGLSTLHALYAIKEVIKVDVALNWV